MIKTLFLTMVAFLLTASEPGKWVKTKISPDITVMLPGQFSAMTPEDLIQRYPSVRTPLGAYTDPDRLADFSVNISATRWPDGNIDFAKSFFKSSVLNMYDRVDMIGEGIIELNKKKFIFFEFRSRLNSSRQDISTQDALVRYTYIMYLVEPERTLVFSFSCTKDVEEVWQPVAQEIMKTVRVK
ncbi:MAG: hypothetical protein ACO3FI_10910 [Cyclobacteriaceae bacterium]